METKTEKMRHLFISLAWWSGFFSHTISLKRWLKGLKENGLFSLRNLQTWVAVFLLAYRSEALRESWIEYQHEPFALLYEAQFQLTGNRLQVTGNKYFNFSETALFRQNPVGTHPCLFPDLARSSRCSSAERIVTASVRGGPPSGGVHAPALSLRMGPPGEPLQNQGRDLFNS